MTTDRKAKTTETIYNANMMMVVAAMTTETGEVTPMGEGLHPVLDALVNTLATVLVPLPPNLREQYVDTIHHNLQVELQEQLKEYEQEKDDADRSS